MYENILVVDDEYVVVTMIEEILSAHQFHTQCYTSAKEALENFREGKFDLILSDYFMPELDGNTFLKEIRAIDKKVPFIVITTNTDLHKAMDLIRNGATDYISKPFQVDELVFNVSKNIEARKNKRELERIEKEKEIIEFERKQLVDWKKLYATKDIKQTEHIIDFITRSVNQAGGYLWLDILKNNITKINDNKYEIDKSLVELIIHTTEENRHLFDNITYISKLDGVEIHKVSLSFYDFYNKLRNLVFQELKGLCDKYERKISLEKINFDINKNIHVDLVYFNKILKELIYNAIKYSPQKTGVEILIEKNSDKPDSFIDIAVKNIPKEMGAKDPGGNHIVGIPFEYSELVFDMFYTIDAYPTILDEEEWCNGTGLYICRKIIQKHGGWISNINGIDYSKDPTVAYVKFKVSLPLVTQ